jgi:mono/diheme cytochrome c family protein
MLRRLALALAGLLAAAAAASAQSAPEPAPDPALVERGAYVARAGDCTACHTAPGGAPFAGGLAIPSPMGPIVSTNITPSRSHGIGGYSRDDFARAVRHGVLPDGTRLYPAMPYPAYAGVADDDIAALYAWLMLAVEPVDAAPAETTALPFPFGFRPLMIGWNLLYGGSGFVPKAGADDLIVRGQYLVETLGHCGTCHSPRNMLMGEMGARFLGGGSVGAWVAPNITSDPVAGIGGWSREKIVAFLGSGRAPGKAVAGGEMAGVVEHSLRHLAVADLTAMAAYLETVPPVEDPSLVRPAFGWTEARPVAITAIEPGNGPTQADLADSSTLDGAILFNGACATCHGIDGAGTPDGTYPSLTANSTVGAPSPANLVLTIVGGLDRRDNDGHAFMQPFADELSDAQVAALASHVTARFGNPAVAIDAAGVAELRAGGPAPWIVAAAPWLVALAGGAVAVIVVGIVTLLVFRRRSGAHHA